MSQKEEFSEKHLKQVMEKWDTEPVPPAEISNEYRELLDQLFWDTFNYGSTAIKIDSEGNIKRLHPINDVFFNNDKIIIREDETTT